MFHVSFLELDPETDLPLSSWQHLIGHAERFERHVLTAADRGRVLAVEEVEELDQQLRLDARRDGEAVARYHKSIERPAALAPNVPVEYVIPFPANDHAFQAGHRIMVQVQSSWFPVIDRNPQEFVPNIFLAQPSDFTATTQRIYRSGARASHIALPVAGAIRP